MAGDTTLVELLYDYFEYDSIIFKICGDVFSRKILPHQVIRRPDPSDLGIAIREKLILNKNLLPGHYQYLIRVWKNQKIVSQLIKDIQVYPPFKIDNTCIESGKKTLTIFPPFDTPDNVKIEIKEVTSLQSDRWVFEEDSIFTLTRIDDLRYCIAIDFRAIENFHLMIDGECIKDTCCNTCSIFINLPTTHYSGVTFYPIEEMIGIIRENKPYVCKIE